MLVKDKRGWAPLVCVTLQLAGEFTYPPPFEGGVRGGTHADLPLSEGGLRWVKINTI